MQLHWLPPHSVNPHRVPLEYILYNHNPQWSPKQGHPLCSKNYCQFFFCHQMRIINIKGILPKSHGCRLKSHRFQRPDSFRFPLCFFIKKCPWYLEYGSHADTDRTAVQWIAAPRCQQHRIHPKSRRRTKDRAYISRIYHIFQNCDPAGIFAYIDYIRKRRPRIAQSIPLVSLNPVSCVNTSNSAV